MHAGSPGSSPTVIFGLSCIRKYFIPGGYIPTYEWELRILPGSDLYSVLDANGYNPYSMPDRDFVPLAVVRQNEKKKFERVGLLPKFVTFPDNVPKPPDPALLPPEKKPDFSSLSTAQIDASFGLNLMKNIFAQMDGAGFSTVIRFDKVNKVELSYTNVISDSIDPVDIAAFIDAPAAPPQSNMITDQLEANNTYVIYDILKSDSFTVKCHAKETADAVTEVNVIKTVLKDESRINIQQESETSLSFSGPNFQTFALRIRPFWIMKDKTGKKQFFFRSKPPSFLERIGISPPRTRGVGRGGSSSGSPPGRMVGDSFVLPAGSFYQFD
jgi:hypothetical protein